MVEGLAVHLERFGPGQHGVILHAPDGSTMRRQKFGERWRKTRASAGLPAARFHDTRHTFASVLLSGGVSVAAAAEYLGHSLAELLRTYAHLVPQDHDRARSIVQRAFAPEGLLDSRLSV